MNLERKHFIIGGSIIAVIALGALTFFILNKPNNDSSSETSESEKDKTVIVNGKSTKQNQTKDSSSTSESSENSPTVPEPSSSNATSVPEVQPTEDENKILTPGEVATILANNFVARSWSMDLENAKKNLDKVLTDNDVKTQLIGELEGYKKQADELREKPSTSTYNTNSWDNMNRSIKEVEPLKQSTDGVYSTLLTIHETYELGSYTEDNYRKMSFRLDENNKVIAFSLSNPVKIPK